MICFDLYTVGNLNFRRNITVGEIELRNPTGEEILRDQSLLHLFYSQERGDRRWERQQI